MELLTIILPALIVLAAVYFLINKFVNTLLYMQDTQLQNQQSKDSKGIRLQAYERLALMCERMRLNNLIMRLKMTSMTNKELKTTLIIAVQKEYEHNLVQQIYVSDPLWKIIALTKDEIVNQILEAYDRVSPTGPAEELSTELIKIQQTKPDSIGTCLDAIRKETALYL